MILDGQARQYKLHKPMSEVCYEGIEALEDFVGALAFQRVGPLLDSGSRD